MDPDWAAPMDFRLAQPLSGASMTILALLPSQKLNA
jgi:hypothetical protein